MDFDQFIASKYLRVNVVQIIKAMENCGLVNILPPSFLSSNLQENGILRTKHIKKTPKFSAVFVSVFSLHAQIPRCRDCCNSFLD